jgi:predicted NBD/HSP70 family sugar kinase
MKALQFGRELNIKRIIKLMREEGPLSRVDISERTNIPQPTITRITEELLKENLLKEVGYGTSTGGRRPVLLALNHTCYYSVGVEIGRTKVKIALTDLNGNLLSFRKKVSEKSESISSIIEYIKDVLEAILEETGIERSCILGVGFGLPGPLNENAEGLISPPNFYNETSIPLKALLEDALQFEVIIDNDANVAALAEKWFGKGMGYDHFAYVIADVGIGSGLILNGELYRGRYGESGEIGHSTINLFGERCSCGNYGCLETYASLPKVEENFKRKLKLSPRNESVYLGGKLIEEVTFDDIINALENGSEAAKQTLEETGLYLGVGLSNMINVVAPDMVIIGGKLREGNDVLLHAVKAVIQSRVLGPSAKKIPVVLSEFREGVVLGAAALVINSAFGLFSRS